MKLALNFLKTTITGGILFLVPVILVAAVIGKAFEISNTIVAPLLQTLPILGPAPFSL